MTALPIQDYTLLDDTDAEARIVAAKEKLGDRLVILGHHYQRAEVFQFADFSGDSLKLARQAAAFQGRVHRLLRCAFHGRSGGYPLATGSGLYPA